MWIFCLAEESHEIAVLLDKVKSEKKKYSRLPSVAVVIAALWVKTTFVFYSQN